MGRVTISLRKKAGGIEKNSVDDHLNCGRGGGTALQRTRSASDACNITFTVTCASDDGSMVAACSKHRKQHFELHGWSHNRRNNLNPRQKWHQRLMDLFDQAPQDVKRKGNALVAPRILP